MTIAWRPSMETGAPVLDAQHRVLVERAASLVAALEGSAERTSVERAMRRLGDYAVRHFSQDEDCAMRGHCPALEWNGAARAELIGVISRFRAGFERQGPSAEVASELERELTLWVARYIPGPEPLARPCAKP